MVELNSYAKDLCIKAKESYHWLLGEREEKKSAILMSIKSSLINYKEKILEANIKDVQLARQSDLTKSMIDRLILDEKGFAAIINSIDQIDSQSAVCGQVIEEKTLANGLFLQKKSFPIGLVVIIFESRPNVMIDAAALCIKSGNAVVLRGGKETFHTNKAIYEAIRQGLLKIRANPNLVSFVDNTDRGIVGHLVSLEGIVDLVIPRGGESLIQAVTKLAKVPVIKHYKGVCHLFIDKEANIEMALTIIKNAKCSRPSACNALESLLVHEDIAKSFMPKVSSLFAENGVKVYACEKSCALEKSFNRANDESFSTEYLSLALSFKIVTSLDEAIDHINTYGSHHSDGIITKDKQSAQRFLQLVDSATVYENASLRFTDGGQFGLGAEMGISTDKLHARGPMGAREMTTYKWLITGQGQVRE